MIDLMHAVRSAITATAELLVTDDLMYSETAPPAPSLVGVEELPAPSSRDALFPKAIGLI